MIATLCRYVVVLFCIENLCFFQDISAAIGSVAPTSTAAICKGSDVASSTSLWLPLRVVNVHMIHTQLSDHLSTLHFCRQYEHIYVLNILGVSTDVCDLGHTVTSGINSGSG